LGICSIDVRKEGDMTTTAMVVMEPGSAWPGWVGDSLYVVAFSRGGEDLVRRTRDRLRALQGHAERVRVAVLACSSTTNPELARDRITLAHALLGAVTTTARGRLILSATRCASAGLRQELLAPTGALTDQLRGTSATVSLRFAEAARVQRGADG
jgi:hypothetical protein